jgi:hypothetical protein
MIPMNVSMMKRLSDNRASILVSTVAVCFVVDPSAHRRRAMGRTRIRLHFSRRPISDALWRVDINQ